MSPSVILVPAVGADSQSISEPFIERHGSDKQGASFENPVYLCERASEFVVVKVLKDLRRDHRVKFSVVKWEFLGEPDASIDTLTSQAFDRAAVRIQRADQERSAIEELLKCAAADSDIQDSRMRRKVDS